MFLLEQTFYSTDIAGTKENVQIWGDFLQPFFKEFIEINVNVNMKENDFIDLDFVSVLKNAKMNKTNIQPPWFRACSMTHMCPVFCKDFFLSVFP